MAIQETSAVSSAAANGKHGHSLISDEKFRRLYTLALQVHFAARDGMALQAGREAVLAGVSADLHPEDRLLADDALPLIETLDTTIFAEQHSHPQPVHATRERLVEALSGAVADRMRRNRRVTVVLFPHNSVTDLLHEARSVASVAKLPVIFVEQGNDQAVVRRGKPQNEPAASELISIPVDAHDVIAIYRVAHESIARARQGNGPTRMVCLSLPASDSSPLTCGNNAVARLEEWMTARGLPVEQWRQEIVATRAIRNSPEQQDGRDPVPQNAA